MEEKKLTIQTDIPKSVYLKDYQALAFQVPTIQLTVELFEQETIVTHTMVIEKVDSEKIDVCLNGEELELLLVEKNGELLSESDYDCTQTHLIIRSVSDLRLDVGRFLPAVADCSNFLNSHPGVSGQRRRHD